MIEFFSFILFEIVFLRLGDELTDSLDGVADGHDGVANSDEPEQAVGIAYLFCKGGIVEASDRCDEPHEAQERGREIPSEELLIVLGFVVLFHDYIN